MPSAVQPGGKYEVEKVSIRTGRPVASSSALDRASRVNGQWVASTMTPVAITPRSMTTLIQSHLGIGRYAAVEDCSMSTWKYKQFECRGPAKKRWAAAKRKGMNSLAPPCAKDRLVETPPFRSPVTLRQSARTHARRSLPCGFCPSELIKRRRFKNPFRGEWKST